MKQGKDNGSKGFVLIACLLLLLLISTLAIGLLMRVRTEASVGANDLQANVAFHAAEGAIEKQTADLSNMFLNIQAPQVSDYTDLDSLKPTLPGVSLTEYSVSPLTDPATGKIKSSFGQITSGANQGLYAQLIPVTLSVTAQSGLSNQVRMIRTAQVALIPIFQFGVFSQGDLAFFTSPDLDFNGRVHTNGDLYLGVSSSGTITFHDKITAYGNVIRKTFPNGLDATSSSYNDTGTVNILAAAGGCDGSKPSCKSLSQSQGSVTGGPTSSQNSSWSTISKSTFNGWIVNGNYGASTGTGATCLSLPFTTGSLNCPTGPGQVPTNSGAQTYEIIRRPPADEAVTSAIGQARLYNQAEIRVLLADDPAENHLDGSAVDGEDIRLANVQTNTSAPDYSAGVPAVTATGVSGNTFFAEGTTDWSQIAETNWLVPAVDTGIQCYPSGSCTGGAPKITASTWNLIDGYLRVEVRKSDDTWVPVTKEWLERGFARDYEPPASLAIHPKAILMFQQKADRDADGAELLAVAESDSTSVTNLTSRNGSCYSSCPYVAGDCRGGTISGCSTTSGTGGCSGGKKKGWTASCSVTTHVDPVIGELATDSGTGSKITGAATRNNWYPINFYDPREGESRDNLGSPAAGSCSVNGVMNAVELDMGNLKTWLADTTGHGPDVDYITHSGYILYYSDRRGMGLNPNVSPSRKTGDSGLEDVVNISGGTAGTPDGVLEGTNDNRSPEDVNLNGKIDKFGPINMGLGFGLNASINSNTSKPNPYVRMSSCIDTGRPNWVSGARHVLRIVDATLGKVPTQPAGTGGFTLASENPVYVLGDYNSNSTQEANWNVAETTPPTGESASSIIADTATLLSNNWFSGTGGDIQTFTKPFSEDARTGASTTHYRVAIAAGKNRPFTSPSWSQTSTLYAFGTDGGLHNFLRFIENWNGNDLFYKGSLVSLFYSTYNTGTFKCCNKSVYEPPDRHYAFDTLFSNPANLPPGTPMFRDVDNLTYRQDLAPR
jgi:Tfp pilus assembly protein PilX